MGVGVGILRFLTITLMGDFQLIPKTPKSYLSNGISDSANPIIYPPITKKFRL